MKKVLFQGSEYLVPEEYKYIAKDDDGYVYAYLNEPVYKGTGWYDLKGGNYYLGNINCLEII